MPKKPQAIADTGLQLVRSVPRSQGALIRTERFRQSGPFGDLTGSRLTSIMNEGERGNITQIAMLFDFIRSTDELVSGAFETRRLRVRQAEIKIVPGRKRATPDDLLAVAMCEATIDAINDFDNAMDRMLLAHCDGWSWTRIKGWSENRNGWDLPRELEAIHARRFRFDEHWQPRLYDSGATPGPDGYGEILNPNGEWIYVTHAAANVYPGSYGIGRSILWPWLFRRWAQRFWIEHLDRYGSPFTYAVVEKNTPDNVREMVKEALDRLTSEHTAVFEDGGRIEMNATASGSGSDQQYERYMAAVDDAIVRRILGTSDLSSPGSHGSNAAVSERVDAAVDPRTRADVRDFWGAIEAQLFRWVLIRNARHFGSTPSIPKVMLARDVGVEDDVQSTALNGAQSESLANTIARAHMGEIPVSAAREIVSAGNPTLTPEALDRMFADVGKSALDTEARPRLAQSGAATGLQLPRSS